MPTMTGGEVVARMLKLEGVEKVFGIIDGTYLGFMAGLRKEGIQLITPRHETSAVHMAAAYARLTGRLGVCMASNGPGVANALPGVAVENGEGNRVLLITSTRRVGISYPDRGGTYQYFNQVGVIKPMSKWSGTPQTFARIPEVMRRALRTCYMGRPGVVHVDVPENLMNTPAEAPGFWEPEQYRRSVAIEPSPAQVKQAAEMLRQARHPIIHAGSGIIHARAFDLLKETAELLAAPVVTSWAARGCIAETLDHAIPMIYVELNNKVRNEADLVLTLGSRLGETDWWGKAPYWASADKQKMIQVDIDESILGMNKPADLPILSDVGAFLRMLNSELKQSEVPRKSNRVSVLNRYQELKQKERAKLDKELKDEGVPMNPAHVATVCRSIFKDDAIVVFDGGNTAVWGNFYHEARATNTLLSTFKFGMLGAGVAQALGAAAAFPDRQVYCLIG
ncbi:MAG: thiamine pyrophosphate-binding protein, partial [Leptospiraceae bacterium]|nr:thiamine pyrophosphate-binding protein [Leptospiraceae bacterium]